MNNVPSAIRSVKTPVIPPDEEEDRQHCCERLLELLQEDVETLQREPNPDVIELCLGAVSDILWEVRHLRANTRPSWTPLPDRVPLELAQRLARENCSRRP